MSTLHTIKAWLYANPLTEDPNDFSARVSAERPLNVREVCQSAVERGGADISAAAMEHAVNVYNKEAAYQLCDGFSVNCGLYNATLHVKGVFDSPVAAFDPEKHTILAEFHQSAALRKELADVTVDILGKAESSFFIARVEDVRTSSVNDLLTPGRNARIMGSKLKIAGENAACGVYFVNTETKARFKVEKADIVENQSGHILVITPPLAAGTYQVEVSTQYGAGTLFKEPRAVTFDRILTVA